MIGTGMARVPPLHRTKFAVYIHPKKSLIATNLESRDHYIMENKQKCLILNFSPPKPLSNQPTSLSML